MTEKQTLTVNRVVAFFAGALLTVAVMSFTVVNSANEEAEELRAALDTSRYEAGRLLSDAEAQFAKGDFDEARVSLETLFENQPGSAQATEGKELLASINSAQEQTDARWEAALPAIREQWKADMAAELREEADAARAEAESEMESIIEAAWDDAKDDLRENWQEQL